MRRITAVAGAWEANHGVGQGVVDGVQGVVDVDVGMMLLVDVVGSGWTRK